MLAGIAEQQSEGSARLLHASFETILAPEGDHYTTKSGRPQGIANMFQSKNKPINACSLICQALEEPEPGWSKAAPGRHVEANARLGFTQETTLVNIKGTVNLTLFQRGNEGINREGCHGLVACRTAHSQLYRVARHSLRVRGLQHIDEVVFPKQG